PTRASGLRAERLDQVRQRACAVRGDVCLIEHLDRRLRSIDAPDETFGDNHDRVAFEIITAWIGDILRKCGRSGQNRRKGEQRCSVIGKGSQLVFLGQSQLAYASYVWVWVQRTRCFAVIKCRRFLAFQRQIRRSLRVFSKPLTTVEAFLFSSSPLWAAAMSKKTGN